MNRVDLVKHLETKTLKEIAEELGVEPESLITELRRRGETRGNREPLFQASPEGFQLIYPERANEVYEFIISYKAANDGNSPRYKEIISATSISHAATVRCQLQKLASQGRIKFRGAGAICVVGAQWLPPKEVVK